MIIVKLVRGMKRKYCCSYCCLTIDKIQNQRYGEKRKTNNNNII